MTSKAHTIRRMSSLLAAAALTVVAAPAALADPPQGHRVGERLVTSERSASIGESRNGGGATVRPDDRAGRRPVSISEPTQLPVSRPGMGFQWKDATIGAAFTAGVLLLAGALAVTLRHRRRIALS